MRVHDDDRHSSNRHFSRCVIVLLEVNFPLTVAIPYLSLDVAEGCLGSRRRSLRGWGPQILQMLPANGYQPMCLTANRDGSPKYRGRTCRRWAAASTHAGLCASCGFEGGSHCSGGATW